MKAGLLLMLLIIGNCTQGVMAMDFEETVFKTGVAGRVTNYAVSPDGMRILFTTKKMADGLRLLDVKTGQNIIIPGEAGRSFGMPNWSQDGQQVVAISTAIRDNYYQVGEQEVILINPEDWSYRKLAATLGVNIFPFFSVDGQTVYYFKGKKRESGKTLASHYDLYAYDLATDHEKRLTHDNFYEVGMGHDNGDDLFFPIYGLKRIPSLDPNSRRSTFQKGLYAWNKLSSQLRLFNIDQNDGFFNINFGGKDTVGNIYFKTAKNRPGGGNFLWFIYRCNVQGENCVMLRETTIDNSVRVALKTKDIFIDDVIKDEVIFRRLVEKTGIQ